MPPPDVGPVSGLRREILDARVPPADIATNFAGPPGRPHSERRPSCLFRGRISDDRRNASLESTIANFTVNDLNHLAMNVWSQMANIELAPWEGIYTPHEEGYVVSSVQIFGTWEGAVRLDMDLTLARRTIAQMLMMEESEITRDDLRDASGELANMTGGGFKEMLPPPCQLSLPLVASGIGFRLQICRGNVVLRTALESPHGRIALSLIEKSVSAYGQPRPVPLPTP